MSSTFRKQSYTRASADHRDFDGFLDDMERALRPLGIYCVNDPDMNGSDMYGVIFQQGPIDPRKLWAWCRKQNPENYEGSRYNKEVEESLTPSSFYEVDSWVASYLDKTRKNEWQVIDKAYSPLSGWRYHIIKHHKGEKLWILEKDISHMEGFDPSPFSTPYKRKYRW